MLLRTDILFLKNVITFTAMTQEKEHILFEDIRNGNEKAFSKAFDLYYSRMCFFADKTFLDVI